MNIRITLAAAMTAVAMLTATGCAVQRGQANDAVFFEEAGGDGFRQRRGFRVVGGADQGQAADFGQGLGDVALGD